MDERSIVGLDAAADALNRGGVIAYPTETVYGLGCLPDNINAIKRLLQIKRRSREKGLILIGANRQQLAPYVSGLNENLWEKIETPGERTTTWIVPTAKSVSQWIRGNRNTLALRITRHAGARSLCLGCNSAIISTSANTSGSPPVQRSGDLSRELLDQLDYLLTGNCGDDQAPSRIEDIFSGEIIRF